MTTTSPAVLVEQQLEHDGYTTAYLDQGSGVPILLIHGSGPGVSGRANWQGLFSSQLADGFRLVAPDVVGFGNTVAPEGTVLDHESRIRHLVAFLDSLGLERVHLLGNSMGGALSLALAARHPERVGRMVLMGAAGISFPLTPALDQVWGYTPSEENARAMMGVFAYDQGLITDALVQLRLAASLVPGVQERYAAAFAAPRQRHIDAMALTEEQLARIAAPTLLLHGAQDQVIPVEQTSLRLVQLLPDAELKVYGRCGHWTQIERAADFARDVTEFFSR